MGLSDHGMPRKHLNIVYSSYFCVCMYICECVYVYVCVCVCVCVCSCVCMCVCVCICVCVYKYVCASESSTRCTPVYVEIGIDFVVI